MKKLLKSLFAIALVSTSVFCLVSCGEKEETKKPVDWAVIEDEFVSDYQAYAVAELDYELSQAQHGLSDEVNKAVLAAYDTALRAIAASDTVAKIREALEAGKSAIADCIPLANGIYDWSGLSLDERARILGLVEEFAVRTGLTGLTLYESGAYQMYNDRIVLGTDTYIPSYGFGTLAEGDITAPLASEKNDAWKMYYHTYEPNDPGSANYWNDQGSQIGDIFGTQAAGYYTTFMSETKDSYVWVPELANDDRPVPLNEGADGTATKFRISIKTGSTSGLKYNTLSTLRAKYNGRLVEKEDYLTPYKILFTQSNQMYRGSESVNSTVKIKGCKDYYDATESCTSLYDAKKFEDMVAIKVYTEGEADYLEWEFDSAVTPFYAMYYITSSLFQPIPEAFVNEVTLKNMWGYSEDKSTTPVDNSLSLGAYTLESWEADKAIVFKKNPNYVYADTKYKIQGIHEAIMPGTQEDENLAFKEWLAGNIDAASVPTDYLEEYSTNPKVKRATGSSNFKLNINACDQETWNKLFGVNGTVSQGSDNAYTCNPALGNSKFRKAINYAINRVSIGNSTGSLPSCSYLSGAYMADAESGLAYNNTQYHKDAVAQLTESTDGFGFSLQLAREYFKMALAELEEDGAYTPGTVENPTVITLEISWMYSSMEKTYHNPVKQMLEDAFNDESVSGGKYKLDVKFWAGPTSYMDVYNKMMAGSYDIGFGSISGNTYNPLDFITVLSANQDISGSFTLNWGPDTNNPEAALLVINGERWSFDAVMKAQAGGTIVKDGQFSDPQSISAEAVANADGTETVTVTVVNDFPDRNEVEIDVVVYGCNDTSAYSDYEEVSIIAEDGSNVEVVEVDEKTTKYVITVSKAVVDAFKDLALNGYDVYFGNILVDEQGNTIVEKALGYYTSIDMGHNAE